MRYLLASLVLTASVAFAGTKEHVLDAQSITVLVTNEGFLGGGRGSGVLVDATHVVTCAHMIESVKDELFVYTFPLGQVVKGHAEYVDVSNDLMLVVLDSSVTASRFAQFDDQYYDGEPITIIGNALGSMKWLVSKGIIAGSERDQVLTDIQINPGNSGGPWINDEGNVIALTDWGITPKHGPGVTGGIPAKKIKELFVKYANSKDFSSIMSQLLGGKKI